MRWSGNGFILGLKIHNEASYILDVFTEEHGRHKGLIRGIHSKNLRAVIEPGNEVKINWSGRLESHLGNYTVEPIKLWSSYILNQKVNLLGISSLCSLIMTTMAEKQENQYIYDKSLNLLKDISQNNEEWIKNYIFWEIDLLSDIGYGLDLSECAVTFQKKELKFVSPSSGKAVTLEGAGSFKDRLFKLPNFLINRSAEHTNEDLVDAFNLTEHFFRKRYYEPNNLNFPKSRNQFKKVITNEY